MVAMQQEMIDLIGSSTFGVTNKINCARTWNMYISDGWFVNYPGWKKVLELTSSIGQNEGRGAFKSTRGNVGVAVVGNTVWELDLSANPNLIGNIDTHTGPVFMDENLNSQICIVDGVNAYIYNREIRTLTKQNLLVDLVPNYVVYHNTYFLFGNAITTGNGAKWFAFSFDTDTTIKSSYELALETKPDFAKAVVRLASKGNNVLVLGSSVAEIHTNVGGAIGYQRVSTINIDRGVISVATIDGLDNFVCWLAINEKSPVSLMVFDGTSSKQISTDGLDHQLQALKEPEKSFGFLYSVGGQLFYQFTFYGRDDNVSFAYNFKDDKIYNLSDWNMNLHPARKVVYLGNRTFFISIKNGSIYETGAQFLSQDENLQKPGAVGYKFENNHEMQQIRVTNSFRKKDSSKFVGRLTGFTVEQGNDLNYTRLSALSSCTEDIVTQTEEEDIVSQEGEQLVTEPSDSCIPYSPCIDLELSKDGGTTFSVPVRKTLNYYGERKNIIRWFPLGQANELALRYKFWGLSRFTCTNGYLMYT